MVFEMDWSSILVGAVIAVIVTIVGYEYKRWRYRMTKIEKSKQ
jgi:purine-cytosine permease-like protein